MITSIEELKKFADGTEVGIPGFDAGTVLTFKLRRPSILDLAKNGKIPNPLIETAIKLFKDGLEGVNKGLSTETDLVDFGDTIRCIVKAALVSPTWEELETAGVTLTDTQLLYIYNYIVSGVDALADFRTK